MKSGICAREALFPCLAGLGTYWSSNLWWFSSVLARIQDHNSQISGIAVRHEPVLAYHLMDTLSGYVREGMSMNTHSVNHRVCMFLSDMLTVEMPRCLIGR